MVTKLIFGTWRRLFDIGKSSKHLTTRAVPKFFFFCFRRSEGERNKRKKTAHLTGRESTAAPFCLLGLSGEVSRSSEAIHHSDDVTLQTGSTALLCWKDGGTGPVSTWKASATWIGRKAVVCRRWHSIGEVYKKKVEKGKGDVKH